MYYLLLFGFIVSVTVLMSIWSYKLLSERIDFLEIRRQRLSQMIQHIATRLDVFEKKTTTPSSKPKTASQPKQSREINIKKIKKKEAEKLKKLNKKFKKSMNDEKEK